MKVLHLSSGNLYGGIETMLVTLAKHRHECVGTEHEFGLCFDSRVSAELRAAGAAVHQLGTVRLSHPQKVWSARRALHRILATASYDVVVCHGPWTLAIFASAVRRHGVPVVLWAHDAHQGKNLIERLAARQRIQHVVANSEYTSAHVGAWLPAVQRSVIYCPVEMREPDRKRSRAEVRQELSTPNDAKVILLVGRMEAGKGHLQLLSALGSMVADATWVCWMVGGPQRAIDDTFFAELKARADACGIVDRVRFTGHRSDVPDLLSAADIYCQPNTRAESFGISLVEALRYSKPIVTSAIGGALEIVDESCGLLIRPDDLSELCDALRRLLDNASLRARLGGAGAARANALCSPAERLRELDVVLRGVTAAVAARGSVIAASGAGAKLC
jgi:glycosyltransferase involved in cell wall biosynthesis